jgi:hypothetical protein
VKEKNAPRFNLPDTPAVACLRKVKRMTVCVPRGKLGNYPRCHFELAKHTSVVTVNRPL